MEQAAKAPFCEAGSLGIWEAGVGGALLKKITKGLYKQNARAPLETKLSAEELMLLNCGVGEDS